jgi:indole-3-glycerol phosphate synthase
MFLEQIVNSTRKSLAQHMEQTPLASLERAIAYQASPRDFAGALRGDDISLIAEVKRASPSKGLLCPNLTASSLAHVYNENGAAAISVLTEPDYFLGSYADLEAVRIEVDLPLLCKDFILDDYQIYKARAHGADAVLLIAAILSQHEMKALLETAHSLRMSALIEVHNREELKKVLKVSPGIIGINNRNLKDFSVSLETTVKLRPLIPEDVLVVSESGIHTRDDVLRLKQTGVNAILVGEALVTSPEPAAKIAELLGNVRRSQKTQDTKV